LKNSTKKKAEDAIGSAAVQIKVLLFLRASYLFGQRRHRCVGGGSRAQNGLDPCLILSIMRQSLHSIDRRLGEGRVGLMQLMPATAARFGVKNIFDRVKRFWADPDIFDGAGSV